MTTSMRQPIALLLLICATLLGSALPAGAQGYEGSNTEDGVFEIAGGEVEVGEPVAFTATGLAPHAVVELVLVDSSGTPVSDTSNDLSVSTVAGPGGTINADVPIPADLPPGSYQINVNSVKADGSDFFAQFDFVLADAGASEDPSGDATNPDLAFTGASSTQLVLGASLLILLGGGLLLSRKSATADQ